MRGIDLESDPEYANDSSQSSDSLTFVVNGEHRTGTIAGMVMAGQSGNVDEDYFDLGTVEAGETILISTRLPVSSTLRPLVEIRDSNNQVVSIGTNPSDAVARADVSTTGTYYAVVLATDGEGAHAQYLMDVAIQPTSELDFADLAIGSITAPASAASGETVTVQWTTGNFGAVETPVDAWSDRVVLSRNDRYGDGDDIQLDVVPHNGRLAVGQSYDVNADVQIPIGLSGDFWLLLETDSGNNVSEFIFENNNITQATNAIAITLTEYADLESTNVRTSAELAIAGDSITISWEVSNVGPGTTGDGRPGGTVANWADRIVLSHDTVFGNADDILVAERNHAGTLAAGESYAASWHGPLPTDISGSFHVLVKTDVGAGFGEVYEYTDAAANAAAADSLIDVAREPFADLVVSLDTAPSQTEIGQAIDVTWIVSNTNNAWAETPVAGWYDRIVLSRDDQPGNSDDQQLANIWHEGALAIGSSYAATATVQIPSDFSGAGYLMVITDSQNGVYEFKHEGNNVSPPRPLQVLAPDLRVDATLSTFSAFFGDTILLDWTVHNAGNAPVSGNVRDRVWLSRDQFIGSDTLLVTADAATTPLEPGTQYDQTDFPINLPLSDSLSEGRYYLIVQTDALGDQPESDESNNTFATAASIQLSYPSLPDLQVSSVGVAETKPTSGEPLTVQWTTVNAGDAPVLNSFSERLVVTNTDTNQTLLSEALEYNVVDHGTIAPGAVVHREYGFTLPDGLPGVGNLRIAVTTDASGNVVESFADSVPETNNTLTTDVVSQLRPYPDLVISSLSVDPTNVRTGGAVTLSWRVDNDGTGIVAETFQENVRIVNRATNDVLFEQTLPYSPDVDGPIDGGEGRDRSVIATIPDGSASVGDLLISVTTDADQDLFELNSSGDAETNNTADGSLAVTLAPYPNLEVTSVTAPSLTIADPAPVIVEWTVQNDGSSVAQAGGWYDVVVASYDATFGNSDDRELARFERTSDLAAGSAYTRSETILLPPGLTGRFTLFVQTDANDAVFEDGAESDNILAFDQPFDVMPIPYSDLVVSRVDVSGQAFSGQSLEVSWRVENQGIGLTNVGRWDDFVWLATDPAGENRAQLLGFFLHLGQLAVDDGYDRTAEVILPDGLSTLR